MSDIHDSATNLSLAIKKFNQQKCDIVIFCGDWGSPAMPNFCANIRCKIVSVFGNNDADIFTFLARKKEKKWNIEFHKVCFEIKLDGMKIVVYHGDSDPLLQGLIDSDKYDLVLSGHDHTAKISQTNDTIHINPGSVTDIHGGKAGNDSTIAIFNTKTCKGEIIKLN